MEGEKCDLQLQSKICVIQLQLTYFNFLLLCQDKERLDLFKKLKVLQ